MKQYEEFAFIYDELMDDVDYDGWVDYIEKIYKSENLKVNTILELACGTGNLTTRLAKRGYAIVGIDISEEMLSVAREKAEKENLDIVFLNQDMTQLDFDVYNIDCVLCGCDGFNYILDKQDLLNIFKKVKNILKDEGLFIFDISSYFKLSTILSNNTFAENRDDLAYIWENYFDEEDNILQMDLAFFVKEKNYFKRFEEVHYQRAYKNEEIIKLLKKAGFDKIKIYKDFTFSEDDESSERVFFIAKK
ncbi:Ubiquinone/menaquinone biosynthesis C-methylase UbiE [Alkalithermobacter thermoalcaliphilus JW-YL-7 = DSM 7308]|uniref:Methyltransferase n=1 Tax=Alkalithermobacter thermoalcaliphilus JW-YL-7 = DSM 7308 TaxID=1121328 RepID=A0A150FRR3_CLOPD|nr:methyltransferase [[Clostridium] paradoxum JW-YL-7 = DSM 7308]SHK40342.1 Ubiquinone/menaquinone biosynthesis C-methylase UbiE [[Clostridium] paradoxum JW-YL-7 = DSM 7308]